VITRRRFLGGMGGIVGATLAPTVLSRIAFSEPRRAPLRLLLVHKPVGTVPATYDCTGDGAGYTLSPILEPFADLREHMVVVDGLENRKQANTPGEDHANCIVTFLTGGIPFKPDGSNTPIAERASVDQLYASDPRFAGQTPIGSLQLTADDRGPQFLMRVHSSAGRGMPLPPEESPLGAFARVFGSIQPAGSPLSRARQQSVLDFTREDVKRLQPRLGSAERARLDRHLTAIREVEQVTRQVTGFDSTALLAECRDATLDDRDRDHGRLGRAHLDLVRVAFQCDLTRVACFTWGSWSTNVAGFVPELEARGYHDLSHSGRSDDETAVHRWYNEQLAAYLRTLRDTEDVDGRSLLDNTLVVSWTEMHTGGHRFDNIPIQLFGGVGGRLAGGRRMQYPGYSTNDLWRTIANALGDRREIFGDADKNSGRLVRLFADRPLDGFTSDPTKAS